MGSGDVKVAGGRASTMKVTVAGSGDVDFRGAADSLRARMAGSGDIRAKQVTGEISKTIMGSGGVTIGASSKPRVSRRRMGPKTPIPPLTRASLKGNHAPPVGPAVTREG